MEEIILVNYPLYIIPLDKGFMGSSNILYNLIIDWWVSLSLDILKSEYWFTKGQGNEVYLYPPPTPPSAMYMFLKI